MNRSFVPMHAVAACCTLLLGACQPEADAPAPPTKSIEPNINPAELAEVTASFRCEEGHRVDIVRDKVARVTLADGRAVKLEVVEDSTPRTFTDNGLFFELVDAGKASLSDEQNQTLSCNAIEKPRP